MLIFIVIITGVVLGYLGSLRKRRFPTAGYIVAALVGAAVGAFLSLRDSAVYLDYPMLNTLIMPVVFSAVFMLMAMLADRKGVKGIIAPALILALAISGFIFLDKERTDTDATSEEAIEQVVNEF